MKIRNKVTGEVREIPETDASKYGIKSLGEKALAVPKFFFPQTTEAIKKGVTGEQKYDINAIEGLLGPGAMMFRQDPLGGATRELATSGVLNVLLGGVANKVLPPILKQVKGVLPTGVQKGINTVKGTVGKKIEEVVTKRGAEQLDQNALLTLVDDVMDFMKRPEVTRDPRAQKIVESVASDIIEDPTLKGVSGLATKYGQEIFGQAGKEVLKRGTSGVTEKNVKKFTGDKLKEEVIKRAPELADLYQQYGQISKLGQEMQNPLKNWWMGGLAGTMLSGAGPEVAAPAAAGISALAMPYSRFMLQRLLYPMLQTARIPATAITNQLLSRD